MELDSRIKEGKRPLTCFDIEEAEQFIGKECYLSNSFSDYADLNNVTAKRILDDVSNTHIPYSSNPAGIYCYCLPCEWVKLPKAPEFEQYTLDTWEHEFELGDVIIFRGKVGTDRAGRQYKCIYAGWRQVISSDITQDATVTVALGFGGYTFKELSELFEIYRDNTWEPFGRKVETIDLNVI